MAAVCFTLFAGELRAKENVTEQEIRQIICQIDNGNYQGAEADLEKVLQKDPQNVYALRLLPGVLANQIKKGDKSPENIARIRKAIQAYEQSLKKLQFPAEEGRSVEFFVIDLYGRISEEEKKAFLLKKAEDPTLPAEERRNAYGSLAVALNTCANDITGTPPVQGIAIKAGKQIYVYTKPRKAEDFNRLKNCTANGMELIDKAIEIEKQSGKESAATWSLKADFLLQKMRIAEMEGKTEEKEQLRTEIDAARKRYR